jgi:Fur family transcriptional regulator, peroxide stress response regulator
LIIILDYASDVVLKGYKKNLTGVRKAPYTKIIVRNDSELAMITTESIIQQLREKGKKITPQRRVIIEVLVEHQDLHPGAHLVYEKAKKKKKSLSLSTTYATLDEFSDLGIIKTLEFDKMENRYEGDLEEHINLICERCKKIMDYKAPLAIDSAAVEKKTGFSITDTRLEYYGLCRECRKGKEGRRDS